MTGAWRKRAGKAGLRRPIRQRRHNRAVSFAPSGRRLRPSLWPYEHRFGLPVNRVEQGIFANLSAKQVMFACFERDRLEIVTRLPWVSPAEHPFPCYSAEQGVNSAEQGIYPHETGLIFAITGSAVSAPTERSALLRPGERQVGLD